MLSSTRHDIFILLFIYTFEQHIPRAYFGRRSDILRILFPFLLGRILFLLHFPAFGGMKRKERGACLGYTGRRHRQRFFTLVLGRLIHFRFNNWDTRIMRRNKQTTSDYTRTYSISSWVEIR
jgi:hypothetical protein